MEASMSTGTLRTVLGSTAVAGLMFTALVFGSVPASATDPENLCGNIANTFGSDVDISTDGAHWYEVCVNDPTFADVFTEGKQDAFDDFGELYFDYDGDDIDIGAPDSAASYSQV